MDDNIETKIYTSVNRKEIPSPKVPFEKFYINYKTIKEVMNTSEWKEIYSNYYDFDDDVKNIEINESSDKIEYYSSDRQIEEMIKCKNSFVYFCIKYVKINHPIFGLIPFIPYTYQNRVIECYGNNRFNILSKFRQGGLTTVSVIWSVWRCLFKTSQKIMVVSKTDREAIAAGEIAKTVVDNLPLWLQPEKDKFNEHEKQFKTTNSILWFYTVEAARGKAITVLIIDEAAFIKDMNKHWKALYPVLATGGCCQVISTVNGYGNWYEEIYHEAEKGENKFNIIELDYWEHPLYNNPKWIEDTRAQLGEKGWQQEVERSFLGSGDTWMDGKVISKLAEFTRSNYPKMQKFGQWKNDGTERRTPWDTGALWIWKTPVEGREYIIAADCAEGVGETGDNSTFQVLDVATCEQVAEFYSNKISPYPFAQLLHQIGIFYKNALIVVENMSQGISVLSTLNDVLSYENLYCEDNKQQSVGIKSSKNTRPLFLETLQKRLLDGSVKVNSLRFSTELSTIVFNPVTKKIEAQRGKHDDAVIALALALYIRDKQFTSMPAGVTGSEEHLKVFKSEMFESIKKEIFSDSEDDFLEEETDLLDYGILNRPKMKRKLDSLLKEFGF